MNRLTVITVTKNRLRQLIDTAFQSLLEQNNHNFEWIVINDGKDSINASKAFAQIEHQAPFSVTFAKTRKSSQGFGLCIGRNLGIELASSEYVCYLDDDNSFQPDFIESTLKFLADNPQKKCSIPQAKRTRGYWQSEKFIATSSFISPKKDTSLPELLTHNSLFDSNGFVHQKSGCPTWNPQFRIYCDYEYFLQCLQTWSEDSFAINYQILVNYTQSDRGVIGSSSYQSWARELDLLLTKGDRDYEPLKNPQIKSTLNQLREKYFRQGSNIPTAFDKNLSS